MARVTADKEAGMARRMGGDPGMADARIADWTLACLEAGAADHPRSLPATLHWIEAPVPGTAAAALRAAGRWSLDRPEPLHDRDVWYRGRVSCRGRHTLRFRGLATLAEVWLDGAPLLRSESMYAASERLVDLRPGTEIHIRFHAIGPTLAGRRGRARWRPSMIASQELRHLRTTLLGHMPGWCPEAHAVGPWREIEVIPHEEGPRLLEAAIHAAPDGGDGLVTARLRLAGYDASGPAPVLRAGEAGAALDPAGPDLLQGTLRLPRAARWWPHTHGEPALHDLTLQVGGVALPLRRVGFRSVALDTAPRGEGFALRINDVPVFCRGACWSSADVAALPGDRASYAPWLRLARDAGMNMIRVPGTTVYETAAFHALCDELGLLVWQDFMFANLDYPAADEGFLALVREEARQALAAASGPSLAVLCGGSEVAQQAAMLGRPPASWRSDLFERVLPEAARAGRPDVPYVPHTPGGAGLPFRPGTGPAHYFGVGAYLRPLSDAREAGVRFAAECLAFANVPEARTLDEALPVPPVHHPRWKARVPRDAAASWDFEDVRDHYLRALFGLDPFALRRDDPALYLSASRAVTGEAMEACYAAWRRDGSRTAGALVLMLQDLWPGAGWGVIDSEGRPKAAWHALRQVLRPVQVLISDDGLDGLSLTLINEAEAARPALLSLVALRDGRVPVLRADREMVLAPRSRTALNADALTERFFDLNRAYCFGAPEHDSVVAALRDARDGTLLSEAFHFPLGRWQAPRDLGLVARPVRDVDGWWLSLCTERLARRVHLVDEEYCAESEWFHLPPGEERRIRLVPHGDRPAGPPRGEVHALNAAAAARYAASDDRPLQQGL